MARSRETVLFVVNPASGTNRKDRLADLVRRRLNPANFSPEFAYSTYPRQATAIVAAHLQQGVTKFVAVGGDGTVNDVASALVNTKACLGIIPLGSGNGLARHLRIPLHPQGAIEVINRGRILMADYATLNGHPYFCASGVGFDAHMGYRFAQLNRRGFAGYLKAGIMELFGYSPEHLTLEAPAHRVDRPVFFVAVANASQYGFDARIAPNADITDGLLDVTVVSPFPWLAAPILGVQLMTHRLTRGPYVEMFQTQRLTIRRAGPGLVHYDGEPSHMGDELTFECKHLGINVFVP